MAATASDPPYDQLLATAEAVAQARPEVDLEMAREVFQEAATLLYNGLALEGLDDMMRTPSWLGCASIWWLKTPARPCGRAPGQR